MNPDDAMKLAGKIAMDHPVQPRVTPEQPSEQATTDTSPQVTLRTPPFLHEREVTDAIRVVNLIASGRNPFSDEPFEKLRPEQRDSVLQALCVSVSAILQARRISFPLPTSQSVSSNPPDPASKRPLEEYLQRMEREAIVEALEETNYNRTAAARLLGITFRALRYRLESLGLDE